MKQLKSPYFYSTVAYWSYHIYGLKSPIPWCLRLVEYHQAERIWDMSHKARIALQYRAVLASRVTGKPIRGRVFLNVVERGKFHHTRHRGDKRKTGAKRLANSSLVRSGNLLSTFHQRRKSTVAIRHRCFGYTEVMLTK